MNKTDKQRVSRIHKELEKLFNEYGSNSFFDQTGLSISVDHALTDVRVNGMGRKIGYPDIKEHHQGVLDDYKKYVRLLPQIKKKLDEIVEILSNYQECPICKGKQIFNLGYHMHEDPEECTKCDGEGVIKKENLYH